MVMQKPLLVLCPANHFICGAITVTATKRYPLVRMMTCSWGQQGLQWFGTYNVRHTFNWPFSQVFRRSAVQSGHDFKTCLLRPKTDDDESLKRYYSQLPTNPVWAIRRVPEATTHQKEPSFSLNTANKHQTPSEGRWKIRTCTIWMHCFPLKRHSATLSTRNPYVPLQYNDQRSFMSIHTRVLTLMSRKWVQIKLQHTHAQPQHLDLFPLSPPPQIPKVSAKRRYC